MCVRTCVALCTWYTYTDACMCVHPEIWRQRESVQLTKWQPQFHAAVLNQSTGMRPDNDESTDIQTHLHSPIRTSQHHISCQQHKGSAIVVMLWCISISPLSVSTLFINFHTLSFPVPSPLTLSTPQLAWRWLSSSARHSEISLSNALTFGWATSGRCSICVRNLYRQLCVHAIWACIYPCL